MFERLIATVVWGAALLVAGMLLWILGDILWHGMERLSLDFLISTPQDAGRAGGIAPILVATLLILAVCLAAALPIGLGAAVFLAEFAGDHSPLGRAVRRSLDVLAGMPSIVFGLFGYVFFAQVLGLGFSILSGGLTLACMVLPLLIRATEEGLRAAPSEYRLGAAALGLSRAAALRHLLLPAALPGLLAGLVLSVGRALAETAALLYTSGYVDRMPDALTDSGRALSIHIFELSMNVPGGNASAYASALVLVLLLMLINAGAAGLARRWWQRHHGEGSHT
ncbi:MAG TPA: phosphate ABC transporter permease PstA [Gammaproteobacteria bacterium]|nr:phosphate ABC transporter permease PstA [Gammaproteobacteria bacterium]